MSFTDRTLTCRDCGNQFTFTAGEQEFYAQKGFTNDPTRCPNCRQARKQTRNSGGGYDSYSSGRDSYSSGRDSYGGGRDSYGGGRGQREMYTTTCSSCGKEAQVPFVPRGDKPVYCNDCFQSHREPRGGRSSRW